MLSFVCVCVCVFMALILSSRCTFSAQYTFVSVALNLSGVMVFYDKTGQSGPPRTG